MLHLILLGKHSGALLRQLEVTQPSKPCSFDRSALSLYSLVDCNDYPVVLENHLTLDLT